MLAILKQDMQKQPLTRQLAPVTSEKILIITHDLMISTHHGWVNLTNYFIIQLVNKQSIKCFDKTHVCSQQIGNG